MTKILLIVDPQNDFVDHRGSLYVPGAESVIMKLCDYIREHGEKYDHLVVTQDTHRRIHISLTNGWTHKPAPGSVVVKKVSDEGVKELVAEDATIKYYGADGVNIWPDHCIIGTWGHCFPDSLVDALSEWEIKKRRGVFYQRKGEDCGYEAYSALTKEQLTGVKPEWRKWEDRDIDVCGFCKDICVAETIKDLVGYGKEENITLLSPLSATLDQKSKNLEVLKELETSGKIKIIESL